MNTILFLEQKNNITSYSMEAIGQRDFLLIKIGLDVEKDRWFERKLPQIVTETPGQVKEAAVEERTMFTVSDLFHPRRLQQKYSLCRRQKLEQKKQEEYRQQTKQLMQENSREILTQMRRILNDLKKYVNTPEECGWIYTDKIRKCLLEEPGRLSELWKECWQTAGWDSPLEKEFKQEAYTEFFWVKQLLPQVQHPHLLFLGNAPCIPQVLEEAACRTKSVRWLLVKPCDEEEEEALEDFAEEFYQEYGLVISLEYVENFAKTRLSSDNMVSILDFSREKKLQTAQLPKGSLLIDMGACEEKQDRLQRHRSGIAYFSLKEKFHRLSANRYSLDITDKNEYNT